MAYLTLKQVRDFSTVSQPTTVNETRKFSSSKKTVFLSHSHEDADIIRDVISFLLSQGIHVYVDWLDPTMPSTTSVKTAETIKSRILQCERFVVLLTENSKDSKWVPWELGFADGKKSIEDIGILPIKRNSFTTDSSFKGLEYMELYPIISEGIQNGKTLPAIHPPNRIVGTGKVLSEGWLNIGKVHF